MIFKSIDRVISYKIVDIIRIDALLITDWIIIHFGENLKNGGYLPGDNSEQNRRNFMIWMLLFIRNIWLIN